eukprot:scaffold8235_cov113-Cylindrotheca_fusiformis.AAC.1
MYSTSFVLQQSNQPESTNSRKKAKPTNCGGERSLSQSLDTKAGSVRVVSGSGYRYVVPFPWRLHQMLEETERESRQGIELTTNVVSWLPDGLHFRVHDSKAFMTRVVPRYFKQKSYKSFQRQLHIYGFKRVLKGAYRGGYFHPKFIKGQRKLTHEIDRIKSTTNSGTESKKSNPHVIQDDTSEQDSCNDTSTFGRNGPQQKQKNNNLGPPPKWLEGAGITTSDLTPINDPSRSTVSADGLSKSLLACADEISFIFHSASHPDTKKRKMKSPSGVPTNTNSLQAPPVRGPEEAFFSNSNTQLNCNPSLFSSMVTTDSLFQNNLNHHQQLLSSLLLGNTGFSDYKKSNNNSDSNNNSMLMSEEDRCSLGITSREVIPL